MRQLWRQFRLDWEQGLRRLPFFTQRAVVALLGVLVATLALLGGLVAIVRAPPPQRRGKALPVPARPGPAGPPWPRRRVPRSQAAAPARRPPPVPAVPLLPAVPLARPVGEASRSRPARRPAARRPRP